MDKSYVTLEQCILCHEDTGNLMLDRRLRETFEMHTTFPTSVCDKCKEKYLKKGVMLVNPETGSLVVLKEEAFKRIFDKPISRRIYFAREDVLERLRLGSELSKETGV
jgi:hypothetical protein